MDIIFFNYFRSFFLLKCDNCKNCLKTIQNTDNINVDVEPLKSNALGLFPGGGDEHIAMVFFDEYESCRIAVKMFRQLVLKETFILQGRRCAQSIQRVRNTYLSTKRIPRSEQYR